MIVLIKIINRWSNDFDDFCNAIISNPTEITEIVFDFLEEVMYNSSPNNYLYHEVIEVAYKNNIPVTIITPYVRTSEKLFDNSNEAYRRINIIHWESFWLNRTYKLWNTAHSIEFNKNKDLDITDISFNKEIDIKYLYLCLNNIAKQHRSLLMDMLAKHQLIEQGAIVWRDILHSCNDVRDSEPEILDSVRMGYNYKYWNPKRMYLDIMPDSTFMQETAPQEIKQTFCHIVTESDDNHTFFTEKTFTSILFNKLFLIAGNKGIHKDLTNLGFELYTEIFDYSFDDVQDIELRYEMLVRNIFKYKNFEKNKLLNIHEQLYPKIQKNKIHAMKLLKNPPKEIVAFSERIKPYVNNYFGPINNFVNIA